MTISHEIGTGALRDNPFILLPSPLRLRGKSTRLHFGKVGAVDTKAHRTNSTLEALAARDCAPSGEIVLSSKGHSVHNNVQFGGH